MIRAAGGLASYLLRSDQSQLDRDGNTVSRCRPDLQYNYFAGEKHMLEEFIDSASVTQTFAKIRIMLTADPEASFLAHRVPYRSRSIGGRKK